MVHRTEAARTLARCLPPRVMFHLFHASTTSPSVGLRCGEFALFRNARVIATPWRRAPSFASLRGGRGPIPLPAAKHQHSLDRAFSAMAFPGPSLARFRARAYALRFGVDGWSNFGPGMMISTTSRSVRVVEHLRARLPGRFASQLAALAHRDHAVSLDPHRLPAALQHVDELEQRVVLVAVRRCRP